MAVSCLMKTMLLLSGGMDSVALCYWKRPDFCVTIDYGQNSAAGECRAAKQVANFLAIPHEVISINCSAIGFGSLQINHRKPPNSRQKVPESWWPYRNQMLITIAAARCVAFGVDRLAIGTVAGDQHYCDGRRSFIDAMAMVLKVQEYRIVLRAPAIALTTEQLIRRSRIPSALLAWAHSCHTAPVACGICAGCEKSARVWKSVAG